MNKRLINEEKEREKSYSLHNEKYLFFGDTYNTQWNKYTGSNYCYLTKGEMKMSP